jgi:ADP-heptose:LPS heptosyltransferase
VGENPTKRVDGPFEHEVLRYLLKRNATVLVDEGAGGEETGRVLRAIARAGGSHRVRTWRGSFARFAATIARAGLYLGYDSAGQHAAAACGVPLVSVFAGAVTPRFFLRWRPSGPGRIRIVDPAGLGPMQVLSATQAALDPFLHSVRPSAGRSLRQIQRG